MKEAQRGREPARSLEMEKRSVDSAVFESAIRVAQSSAGRASSPSDALLRGSFATSVFGGTGRCMCTASVSDHWAGMGSDAWALPEAAQQPGGSSDSSENRRSAVAGWRVRTWSGQRSEC